MAPRTIQLAVSTYGLIAGTVAVNAGTFLIPYFHIEQGLSLPTAGLIAAAPLLGTMVSLVIWGAVVDAMGERFSMTSGLALATLGATATLISPNLVALWIAFFICGAGAASVNSASGRIVVGHYPPSQRGTAMGIRQTASPLGVGIAALTVPTSAHLFGLTAALSVPLIVCGIGLLVSLLVVDPERPDRPVGSRPQNPYRLDARLARIHIASMLLVVPQFTVWTFMLVWLVAERGWSVGAASALVAATQGLGAAGRIAAGRWSDVVGSRMGPLRTIAWAAAISMFVLGLTADTNISVLFIVIASVITVADNGLAYTAVAEIAGPFWSGRALGAQNTGQFLAAAAVPPAVGVLLVHSGYGVAFAAIGLFALLAVPFVPARNETEPL